MHPSIKNQLKAFQAQNSLFEILLKTKSSSLSDKKPLKVTMKEALKVATKISGADNGSLFLLDENSIVTDSILTRKKESSEKQSKLIGSVLEKGLAGWVRTNLKIGLVSDVKTDARWHSFPNQPYTVRSALAIPILRHNALYGILTLMHPDKDYFGEDAIALIQMTADQMAVAIENAQLYTKLEESYQSIHHAKKTIEKYSDALSDELKKGQKIQKEFLPYKIPRVGGCNIEAYFHPALKLSGDFYDTFMLPEDRLGIVIADVSDKGVGAALFMALVRSLIRIFSQHFQCYNSFSNENLRQFEAEKNLSAVTLTNEYIALEHGDEGMFVTLFFGVLEPSTGLLSYINSGHEPLLIVNKHGIKTTLKPVGPAIGVVQGIVYESKTIRLNSGDMLLGFTDGVTEARSPVNEMYTRKRLEKIARKSFCNSSHDFISKIEKDLSCFIDDAPQADDITLLAIYKD